MSPEQQQLNSETLLKHSGFLRALSRELVGPSEAEDLVQETWLRALKSPPRQMARRWLGVVARNVSREKHRASEARRTREQNTARFDAEPSASDVAGRLEVHRQIVEAIAQLDTESRRIVVWRFFDGKTPQEIARQLDLPGSTVRARLRRALEKLRKTLDKESGGRQAWVGALLPLLGKTQAPVGPMAEIGTLMSGKTTATLGVLVLAIVCYFFYQAQQDSIDLEGVEYTEHETTSPRRHLERTEESGDKAKNNLGEAVVDEPTSVADLITIPKHGIYGRVIDMRRMPATGVAVILHTESKTHTGRTDAEGRFAFDTPQSAIAYGKRFILRAFDTSGHGALTERNVDDTQRQGPIDIGTLILRPATQVDIVVASGGVPVASASVVLESEFRMIPMPPTNAEGKTSIPGIPRKSWRAIASLGDERGSEIIRLYENQFTTTIELKRGRKLAVTVIDEQSREPLAGVRVTPLAEPFSEGPYRYAPAKISVHPTPDPTNAEGEVRFQGLPADKKLSLRIEAAGYVLDKGKNSVSVAEDASELVVELKPARKIRWPIVEGEAAIPADGTTVKILPRTGTGFVPPTVEAQVENGELIASGFSNRFGSFLAETKDGTFAVLSIPRGKDIGRAVSFAPYRKVTVKVKDPAGQPVLGLFVQLRNQGNNPFGPAVKVNESGIAVVEKLTTHLADVYIGARSSGNFLHGRLASSVDLNQGDATVDATWERPIKLEAKIRIEGEPRLPTSYSLRFEGALGGEVEEDPNTGIIKVDVFPGSSTTEVKAKFDAEGYCTNLVPIPRPTNGNVSAITIDVVATTSVVARLNPPADDKHEIILEANRLGKWTTVKRRFFVGGRVEKKFTELEQGTYRLRDRLTGVYSEEISVARQQGNINIAFDLSKAGDAKGILVFPEGERPTQARLDVTGSGLGDRKTVRINRDGTFAIRVPGDREVEIRPRHPMLLAADPGIWRASAPREGMEISLIKGPTAVFSAPSALNLKRGRVLVFAGKVSGKPLQETSLYVRDGHFEFGGFKPGQYSLFIDLEGAAPFTLSGHRFKEGQNDLGQLNIERGATLQINVASQTKDAPRLVVSARTEDGVKYSRWLNSNGERKVKLTGLAPGTFKVSVVPVMSMAQGDHSKELKKTITVSSLNETVELPYNL